MPLSIIGKMAILDRDHLFDGQILVSPAFRRAYIRRLNLFRIEFDLESKNGFSRLSIKQKRFS